MKLEELEAKVKMLEDKVRTLDDVEEIKKLQRIYGYYLDYQMIDEIIDLFSDDTESAELGAGVYLGKEGVKRLFKGLNARTAGVPGRLWQHIQLQGVVNVDPGGKTAKGRWRCLYCLATLIEGEKDKKLRAIWGHGHYENEYIKEGGKWKFKKFQFFLTFRTPYEDGWVKTPVVGWVPVEMLPEDRRPDRPPTGIRPYPSGDIVPFHYKHPITGK
jgi:hypothetical protein